MALTLLQQIRYELGDVDTLMPLMTDTEYEYFLEKHTNNVRRASLDAGRVILLKLSMRGDETVDIFSVKGSKAAEAYRMALELYLKNPDLNPVYNNVTGYAGGVSLSDMQANIDNADNNIVTTDASRSLSTDNPFLV